MRIPFNETPHRVAHTPVRLVVTAIVSVGLLAACAGPSGPNARLDAAQSAFQQARADTARAEISSAELEQAQRALKRAESAWKAGDKQAEVDHLAILAQRQVELAVVSGERKQTERGIEQSARERDAIQLQSSRQQTDRAQSQATTAQMQSSELTRRNESLQQSEAQAQARSAALADRLRALQAKETERGLVVTFSDVLFDIGRAELRSGALARVDQLASVMKEYPERNVLVEGFTDSTGSQATNDRLSQERAMSVRNALVSRGIDARRIVAKGHADRYPVATNDTQAGRQQNRRVEAVLSDAKGDLPMRP